MDAPQLYAIDEARERLGGISRAKICELLNVLERLARQLMNVAGSIRGGQQAERVVRP